MRRHCHRFVCKRVQPIVVPPVLKQDKDPASLKEQSAWLLGAKLVGFAFAFLLPLVIVRYLSQDAVGRYREAFQVITNAIIILPLGFSMSAFYFLSREKERRSAAILNILIFNFVVGGVAFLVLALFPQIVGSVFRSEELAALSPKIGIVIWIWMFSTFLETVAIANGETRTATVFIIGAQFTKTLLMGAAVVSFGTVEAFLYAAIIQGVLQTAILLWYLRSRFPRFWQNFDARFFREQMAYAIPFGLAGILWIAQTDIHHYFVGYGFSTADFAIYAYGCFEVPLIAMLSDSVTSVLIPRMTALQHAGDRDEMIRLTSRAMQKLALVYFAVYAFLFVTAQTFIVTLFTKSYEQSASVFAINLTLLPIGILVTDPIIRAYKELGRQVLIARVAILVALIATLYYGLGNFGLTGMITAAVAAIVVEKGISVFIVTRKLNLGRVHLSLVSGLVKTAAASAFAGVLTWFVYVNARENLFAFGERMASEVLEIDRVAALNFIGGVGVLAVCAAVFVPVYLIAANLAGVIDVEDKQMFRNFFARFLPEPQREAPATK